MSSKRQITKETKSVGLIQFRPDPAINGGICVGYLDSVEVGEAEYKDDSKVELFRGSKVPRLNFIFKGYSKGSAQETYIRSFLPYDPMDKDTEEKNWDSLSQTVKHFAEVLKSASLGKDLDDVDYELLQMDYGDNSKDAVIKGFTSFFTNVAILFNGGVIKKGTKNVDVPCITKKDGSPVKLHLKLLLYLNGREVNNGNPGMSSYVGDGLIEPFVKDIKPRLRIRVERGESITPKERVIRKPVSMADASPEAGSSGSAPSAIPDWMNS